MTTKRNKGKKGPTTIRRYRCLYCGKYLPEKFDFDKVPVLRPWSDNITFGGFEKIVHQMEFPIFIKNANYNKEPGKKWDVMKRSLLLLLRTLLHEQFITKADMFRYQFYAVQKKIRKVINDYVWPLDEQEMAQVQPRAVECAPDLAYDSCREMPNVKPKKPEIEILDY